VQADLIILIALLLASMWTVMTRSLLRSAIGLASVSALLSILMFKLSSPLAAVFELSVCSGLISVLFVSTISLTHPLTREEVMQHMKERITRFWFLPFIVIVLVITFSFMSVRPSLIMLPREEIKDVRIVLWHIKQIDVFGQIIVLLSGVFGVVILFKERIKR